ncbi:MAG: helix-turn-helix transcriptional regulator [Planctomycetes bacterium]|nr:helix-turn-helix transcriptional regulator [Planctomycetota bacterium]
MSGLAVTKQDNAYFGRLPNDDLEGYQVVRIAMETWGAGSGLRRSGNPLQALVYVFKGTADYTIGGKSHAIGPGSLFGFGPGDRHELDVSGPYGLELAILTFTGKSSSPLVRENLGATAFAVNPVNTGEIAEIFHRMHQIGKASEPYAAQLVDALVPVLLLTVRKGLVGGRNHSNAGLTVYFDCRRHMERNFLSLNSAAETAEAIGLTHAHLCRLFRRHAGMSPHLYLLRLKMNHAAQRILTEDIRLEELADSLGFSDSFSFSKSFKRTLGLSPAEYRRSHMGQI